MHGGPGPSFVYKGLQAGVLGVVSGVSLYFLQDGLVDRFVAVGQLFDGPVVPVLSQELENEPVNAQQEVLFKGVRGPGAEVYIARVGYPAGIELQTLTVQPGLLLHPAQGDVRVFQLF